METTKVNKLVLKNFIKESPAGPRLQSLRQPRDLRLGGSKLPKKIFKPNLNVSRNKDKLKEALHSERGSRESRRVFQNVQKQRFVQSTGVFSEGIGGTIRIPEKKLYTRDVEKANLKITKASSTPNKQVESEVSSCLIKYEEDSDSDNKKESDASIAPINWSTNSLIRGLEKDEFKMEITDFSNILQTYDDSQEICDINPSMTLWQLPDSFGIKTKVNKKLVDCKLRDLPEGKIGKMCIRKSGKVDICVGNIKYELEPSDHESFTEEIVSLNAKNSDEFVATVLNKIDYRFILNPSWKHLLH